jgi:hypothetical protein
LYSTKVRTNASGELFGLERFGDVIVGTRFQTSHNVEAVFLGSDDNDRYIARLANGSTDIETAHIRQLQVNKHQRGLVVDERLETIGSVPGLADLIALVFEDHFQHHSNVVVIFDGEQPRSHRSIFAHLCEENTFTARAVLVRDLLGYYARIRLRRSRTPCGFAILVNLMGSLIKKRRKRMRKKKHKKMLKRTRHARQRGKK